MEELSAEQSRAGLVSSTSLSIVKDSGHLTWVMLQQPQEQHCPFLLACAVFLGLASSFWIVNVHDDVDVYDCTWSCANAVRESTLEVDPGRKIPCHTRDSKPVSILQLVFQPS